MEQRDRVTYETFVRFASQWHPTWRTGQHAFNVLHRMRPDLADQIRGTHNDPFYLNERLDSFYSWVHSHWVDT